MAVPRQHSTKTMEEYDREVGLPPIHEATQEEWTAMFDARAREWLGMSGDEFIRRWEAGEIEDPDRTDIMMLVFMIPGTR